MTTRVSKKQYEKELQDIKEEIERRTGKTTEQLYEEREKRTRDAIELREPDRVPIALFADSPVHTGVPKSAAYYDPIAYKRGMRQIALDFEPDMCNTGLPTSGTALELLDVRLSSITNLAFSLSSSGWLVMTPSISKRENADFRAAA